ncbi:Hypp9293 [Branchiostoma lanceolatum]|uniref:Hypp9293 protein n=1 Tax=Branchiostoma lanceolatum TaxID=7740 RepID=A0A8J9ZDJ1_BRALA|nr:Hypp9293 [Branchiostoma lanceolatum]
MDVRHLVGVVLVCLGLAFFLIGVITPVWVSHQPGIWPPCHGNTTEVSMGTKGLWEECSRGKRQLRCTDEKGQPDSSTGTGQPNSLNGTGQPSTSNGTGQPSTSNGTGQPSTSNGTAQPSTSNGTAQPITSNGTGQPNTSNGTGQPRCLDNQTTTFHVARFSVMLGLMLLLPGAFLAVTTACRGELDSELDGLEIFTTLIILGGPDSCHHGYWKIAVVFDYTPMTELVGMVTT